MTSLLVLQAQSGGQNTQLVAVQGNSSQPQLVAVQPTQAATHTTPHQAQVDKTSHSIIIIISLFTHCNEYNGTIKKKTS